MFSRKLTINKYKHLLLVYTCLTAQRKKNRYSIRDYCFYEFNCRQFQTLKCTSMCKNEINQQNLSI